MQPYIIWSTYKYYTLFLEIEYCMLIFGIGWILYGLILNSFVIEKYYFTSACIFGVLAIYVYCTGESSQIGQWGVLLQYIFLLLLLLVNDSVLHVSLDKIALIMAIILIPALVVLVCRYVGINIPHTILLDYKEGNRVFLQYPLSIATSNQYSTSIVSYRLNGMFDEPGALGTYLALILTGRKYDLKNKINLILFIAGCLTVSTAFAIISLFYLAVVIIKRIRENKLTSISKRVISLVLLVFIVLVIVMLMNPSILNNTWLKFFAKLSGNNLRGTKDVLAQINNDFLNNKDFLFGKGYAVSELYDSGTILMLFYKIGLIGMVLAAIYLIFIKYKVNSIRKDIIVRLVMMLVLIQRPYLLMFPYISLYIMALVANQKEVNEKK